MNISEVKKQSIGELAEMAKQLNVPGASGMRRQDLIFAILQYQSETNELLRVKAFWKPCLTVSDFFDLSIIITFPDLTIYMSLRHRSGGLV
jgi:transcription termination factor Rho